MHCTFLDKNYFSYKKKYSFFSETITSKIYHSFLVSRISLKKTKKDKIAQKKNYGSTFGTTRCLLQNGRMKLQYIFRVLIKINSLNKSMKDFVNLSSICCVPTQIFARLNCDLLLTFRVTKKCKIALFKR